MNEGVFYKHFAGDPYFNMAFDEWMFTQAFKNEGKVFLRLYSWDKGAITFGFNQRVESALDYNKLNGTPVIRRITGGRALFHEPSELTYSLAVNSHQETFDFLGGSISKTSSVIARVLIDFLSKLGVQSHYMLQSSKENAAPDFFHKAPCFASHAKYEIVTDRQKIIASAQRRIGKTIFQHGSIKINGAASHPALLFDSVNCLSPKELRHIKSDEFHQVAVLFVQSFESFFKVSFRMEKENEPFNKELKERILYVKKNSFLKRNIFKQ
ncbi:MAG: lipoate--protein ligase family protein [FCB group bacterium]|nr:lipoate--protein ligase family protein [FCB group bacterium]